MTLRLWALPLCLLTALMLGCKPGYNRSPRPADSGQKPPECATTPANTLINQNALEVFKVLANLTCYESIDNGNMFGQILGSGTLIATADDNDVDKTFDTLVTPMTDDYEATPVVIETDYALDDRYGYDELKEANDVLEQHWLNGGLVSISWSPMNPWATEQTTAYTSDVNLADLIDPTSDIYDTWEEYLTEIADALENMRRRGIVVLWRPLPEMNDDRFWWAIEGTTDAEGETDATLYKKLWQDMFEYFQDRQLHNLLWVYSPVDADSTNNSDIAESATWAYPGKDYVDVVAPVVRADSLQISDYEDLLELERPLAVASWGPSLNNSSSLTGRFDAGAYSDRLIQSYPFVAYWLAPYSVKLDDDQTSQQALVDLSEITGITERTSTISLEEAKEEGLLSTRSAVFDTSTTISAAGL